MERNNNVYDKTINYFVDPEEDEDVIEELKNRLPKQEGKG